MNPWDIVAWVGATATALVIATVAVAIIVGVVRSIRHPQRSTSILKGGSK